MVSIPAMYQTSLFILTWQLVKPTVEPIVMVALNDSNSAAVCPGGQGRLEEQYCIGGLVPPGTVCILSLVDLVSILS